MGELQSSELIEPLPESMRRDLLMTNFKSLLQQFSQKCSGETPEYQVLDEKGPDHSKCFEIAAVIGSEVYPPAWGASKKEAQQQAARNALVVLDPSFAESGVLGDSELPEEAGP